MVAIERIHPIDLIVSYEEKDEAKKYGARWNPDQGVWYVPQKDIELVLSQHEHWIMNVRAPSFHIAEAVRECRQCKTKTRIYGIALSPRHEKLYYEYDDESEIGLYEYIEEDSPSGLGYVHNITKKASRIISAQCVGLTFDYSKTIRKRYLMNHCQECGSKQGDFYTHDEVNECSRPIYKKIEIAIGCNAGSFSYRLPELSSN